MQDLQLLHVGSDSLTRNQTQPLCILVTRPPGKSQLLFKYSFILWRKKPMGAKWLRPMKVTSEVLTESGDWGTRWVLSLFGATQLVKVDCKNGPSSWQDFSLQRQSASPALEFRLSLTLALDNSYASGAQGWALSKAAKRPAACILQLLESQDHRVNDPGLAWWATRDTDLVSLSPWPRPAKPRNQSCRTDCEHTVNTEYSQPRLREEWTSWAWPKLQTHRTVS